MNIIEKLGIKYLKHTLVGEGFFNSKAHTCFVAFEVRELEQQRNELLEALIMVRSCGKDERMSNEYLDKVIEKATGKTWEEIKKL